MQFVRIIRQTIQSYAMRTKVKKIVLVAVLKRLIMPKGVRVKV